MAAVDAAKKEGALTGAFYAEDMFGRPVLLFRNAYTVERLENDADLPATWAPARIYDALPLVRRTP